MATASEIVEGLKKLNLGASNTDLSSLQGGALEGLVNQLVPERKPIDPALLTLIASARMTEASSKPGATALGGFVYAYYQTVLRHGISVADNQSLVEQIEKLESE